MTAQKDKDSRYSSAFALGEFANLDESSVEYFRKKYPRFMPDEAWGNNNVVSISRDEATNPAVSGAPLWQGLKQTLNELWKRSFPTLGSVEAIVAIAKCSKNEKIMDHFFEHGVIPNPLPPPEVWDSQEAIMYMSASPWRAGVCGICGKSFVKDKPGRRFCSEDCFKQSRIRSGSAWWAEHGENWRRNRTKKTSKTKRSKA